MPCRPSDSVRLGKLPFGLLIGRSVFSPPMLQWIDGEVARVKDHEQLWVPALMAHYAAHQVLTRELPALARQKAQSFGKNHYRLKTKFCASWEVYEVLWRCYLENKPALAHQLQRHPYEREVLRNSKYFGAAIAGIVAELDYAAAAAPQAGERDCPFCAERIKAAAVVCRYCQRDLPPAK
jgi:hypothetical protein